METSPNYGVSIKCNANGLQPMQVTWFKFRVPLSNDNPAKWIVTPDGTLIIPTPIKSDSGLYECMVTNEIGAAISSRAIELVVNKGSLPPSFSLLTYLLIYLLTYSLTYFRPYLSFPCSMARTRLFLLYIQC